MPEQNQKDDVKEQENQIEEKISADIGSEGGNLIQEENLLEDEKPPEKEQHSGDDQLDNEIKTVKEEQPMEQSIVNVVKVKPHEEFDYICPPEFDERKEMRKMFVGGLDAETTDEEFKELFTEYGEIIDSVVIRANNKKSDRLIGFVTFSKCDELEECLLNRPHKYKDKELDARRAVPKGQEDNFGLHKVKKLHVANIPKDMDTNELMNYLKARHPIKYGTFVDVNFLKDSDSKNRGYGFVTVSTEDFADRIAIGESKFTLNGNNMRIAKSKPKNPGGNYGQRGYYQGFHGNWGPAYGTNMGPYGGQSPGFFYGSPGSYGGGGGRYHPYWT